MGEIASSFAAGAALGLSAGLAPGPLTALLVAETLRHGRGAGLRVALVPLGSDLPIVLLSLLAVSRLTEIRTGLGVICLLGALFLVYLGWEGLTLRASHAAPGTAPPPAASFRKGLVTNLLNPHPYVFWLTVGAPLVLRPTRSGASGAFVVAFYALLVGTKLAMALLVARYRHLLATRAYLLANRLLGLALLLLAGLLLRDGLRYLGV
ncbi:MAG: LysE family transporter [Candidatus Latescibacterota bacterium]